MKKSLVMLALLAAFGAQAQTSTSGSTSSSTSSPTITSGNSSAGSESSSVSNPNNQANQQIQINSYAPDRQAVESTSTNRSTSESTARVINEGTSTQNVHYSGSQTVKNVPGIAMSGPASGPCTGASGGLGVAGPGFGVGLNGAKVDDGCTVRENTRTLGQVYQALPGDDPMKQEAKAALMEGMAGLRAMNAKIIGDYVPKAEPKKTAEAPAPAPVVAATPATPAPAAVKPAAAPTPVAQAVPAGYVMPAPKEPTDPYVRARMGLPKL